MLNPESYALLTHGAETRAPTPPLTVGAVSLTSARPCKLLGRAGSPTPTRRRPRARCALSRSVACFARPRPALGASPLRRAGTPPFSPTSLRSVGGLLRVVAARRLLSSSCVFSVTSKGLEENPGCPPALLI